VSGQIHRVFTIKRFLEDKGYGFAACEGEEAFFHVAGYRKPSRTTFGRLCYEAIELPKPLDKVLYEGVQITALEESRQKRKDPRDQKVKEGMKIMSWVFLKDMKQLDSVFHVYEERIIESTSKPRASSELRGWVTTRHVEKVYTPVFVGSLQKAMSFANKDPKYIVMEAKVYKNGLVNSFRYL
jgi:hypothetical protein